MLVHLSVGQSVSLWKRLWFEGIVSGVAREGNFFKGSKGTPKMQFRNVCQKNCHTLQIQSWIHFCLSLVKGKIAFFASSRLHKSPQSSNYSLKTIDMCDITYVSVYENMNCQKPACNHQNYFKILR